MTKEVRFLRSWRWFGPEDTISLGHIGQTIAESIVTALHHIPNGSVWGIDEILKRKSAIENHGFTWSVVESLPIHEEIKFHGLQRKKIIENYKQSLCNLGKCGITKVCYNFMPVIDWVRTDLHYMYKNRGISMLFDYPTFVAFDMFILKRPDAEEDYSESLLSKAHAIFAKLSARDQENLAHNMIVVTQGFIDGGVGTVKNYKKAFLDKIALYNNLTGHDLRGNLISFLNEVIPIAEEYGIVLCLHPDDPPFPVLGLPRIAGTLEDYQWIMEQNSSNSNGITFCTGSLSSRADNDLHRFMNELGEKVHFAHLRNTSILDETGSFCESGHLEGNVDMPRIIGSLHKEMRRRSDLSMKDWQIPVRPDHGLKLPKDQFLVSNPGYPFYGRKQGLEEIWELEKHLIHGNDS